MFFEKKVVVSLLGGIVLGKAGETIFGSETARKVYTKAATGAFIAKDSIMELAEKVQAGAMDIAADARIEADNYQAEKDARLAAAAAPAVEEVMAGPAEAVEA